jgi:phage terminase small subunit
MKESPKLTARQLKFCEEYQLTLNATQSAIKAGYSEKTANRIASENLSKPDIQKKIQQLQLESRKQADITKKEILSELAAILRANIKDYLKFDGKKLEFKSFDELTDAQTKAIESIKKTRHGIELKLHGKLFSIDRISKLLGFDMPQDINIMLEKMDEATIEMICNRIIEKNG